MKSIFYFLSILFILQCDNSLSEKQSNSSKTPNPRDEIFEFNKILTESEKEIGIQLDKIYSEFIFLDHSIELDPIKKYAKYAVFINNCKKLYHKKIEELSQLNMTFQKLNNLNKIIIETLALELQILSYIEKQDYKNYERVLEKIKIIHENHTKIFKRLNLLNENYIISSYEYNFNKKTFYINILNKIQSKGENNQLKENAREVELAKYANYKKLMFIVEDNGSLDRFFLVNATNLILRTGPNQKSNKIVSIPIGGLVFLKEKTFQKEKISGKAGEWYKVVYEGLEGYVFSAYLKNYELNPLKSKPFAGKIIHTIDKGDFIDPVFSPNGRYMAYIKLYFTDSVHNEVYYFDLKLKKTVKVYAEKKIGTNEKYDFDSAVCCLNWKNNRQLNIGISDGDVDVTNITVDIFNKKIIHNVDSDYEFPNKVRNEFITLFPEVDFKNLNRPFFETSRKYFNNDYYILLTADKYDNNHLFRVDIKKMKREKIFEMWRGFNFLCALSHSNLDFFIIERDGLHFIYTFDGKYTKLLDSFYNHEFGNSHISDNDIFIHNSNAYFLIRHYNHGDKGNNTFVKFLNRKFIFSNDYDYLHTARIDNKEKYIAFCYWVGNVRHITIRKLLSNNNKKT